MAEITNDVKEEVKPETAAETPAAVRAVVTGQVIVVVQPDGAIAVNSPGDILMALAILKAGEVFLEMKMQDGMRQNAAMRPPTIVPAASGALKELDARLKSRLS